MLRTEGEMRGWLFSWTELFHGRDRRSKNLRPIQRKIIERVQTFSGACLCLTFKMSHGRSGPLALASGSAVEEWSGTTVRLTWLGFLTRSRGGEIAGGNAACRA